MCIARCRMCVRMCVVCVSCLCRVRQLSKTGGRWCSAVQKTLAHHHQFWFLLLITCEVLAHRWVLLVAVGLMPVPPSSFLPHKEFRFILPTLPPIACLVGQLQLLMQHTLTHPSPLSSFLPSCLLIALTHRHPSLPSSPFTVCNVCQSIGVYLMCLVHVILLH